MNRTEFEGLTVDELIDRITVLEERERRAAETVTVGNFNVMCRWVAGVEAPGATVPYVDIAQMMMTELVEAFERPSPLEPRVDGHQGPFLKSAAITYTQGSFQRTGIATYEEEAL
jgi:hypothetical protein